MRKRNRTITIRCTDDEYERIHSKADRYKLSLDQTSEITTLATEQLKEATADLSSQAGKLNEQYGSKLKELDEYKHKLRLRVAKWIVISQSVLIALSAALQLWLR